MEFKRKDIFLIPNILTYIRFICVPFFIWFTLDKDIAKPYNMMVALAVFLFASITDVIDGKIARKFNMISDIGKVLDPFADKLLQVSALICLSITYNIHYAFAIVLLVKELYMVVAASIIVKKLSKDINIQANIYGKIAAAFNALGIILSFFHNLEGARKMFYIDWIFVGIGCVLAILAAVMYSIEIGKKIKIVVEERRHWKI